MYYSYIKFEINLNLNLKGVQKITRIFVNTLETLIII